MGKFKIGDKVMIKDGKLTTSGTPVYWLGCIGVIKKFNSNNKSSFPYLVEFAPKGSKVNVYSLAESELQKINSDIIRKRLGIK